MPSQEREAIVTTERITRLLVGTTMTAFHFFKCSLLRNRPKIKCHLDSRRHIFHVLVYAFDFAKDKIYQIQGSAKRSPPGLVNLNLTVAYHFYLTWLATFT